MLEVVPQSNSALSKVLDFIGLDVGPYRWRVIGSQSKDRRGDLTIDNMVRHGTAYLDSGRYQMNRSGVLETNFELLAPDGKSLATATRRATGIVARETTIRFAGEPLTLTGGKRSFSVTTASKRNVGNISLTRDGWTVRRIRAYLAFNEDELSAAVQVFLFWLCIYQELSSGGAGN